MKKLFLLDYKDIEDNDELLEINNSVYQIFKRYTLGIADYENNELTEAIFNRLGWSNRYKDTIFSFFRIICAVIEVYSDSNIIRLDNGSIIKFYYNNNMLNYKIDSKKSDKYKYTKSILYEKATENGQSLKKLIDLIFADTEIFDLLKKLAKITDSLSNFTPHPGYKFNQSKGLLTDVADSLNLMIDKIQECIDNNAELVYGDKYNEKVGINELKKWKEWFITNQSVYCLNNFYMVTKENRIKGIQLFNGQSLSKPLPRTRDEIKEYLAKIIKLLENRGEMMNESIH